MIQASKFLMCDTIETNITSVQWFVHLSSFAFITVKDFTIIIIIIINVPLQNPIDRYHGIKQYMHGTVTLITARPQPRSPHPVYRLDKVEKLSLCALKVA